MNANQKGVWNFFKAKLKKWFGGDQTLATLADKELAEMARSIYRRSTTPESPKPSNRWEAFTPENNGRRVGGIWQIVNADSLKTSTDKGYDDKLQPRNRQRKGSDIQTAEIATNLNPDLLGASAKSSDGAPIVDSRGMVVSGNGRTLAIRKAYGAEKTERAEAYKNFVLQQAEKLGLDVPASIKKPMLVRRVDDLGGLSMEDFAARSNKSDLAGMSNAENAIADARRILDAHLLDRFFPSDNGDVLAASNNDFITGFLDIIGGREEYIDKNGARKSNLAPRIKSAVLAAMLNPEKRDIVEDLLDNPQGWSGLINGLFGSVANLAKLDGNADYNLADELSQAVEIFVGLQRAGESVATFNAQGDMFKEPISDEVGFLIELFEKNTRTPTGISGVLNEYYNLVKNIDTTTQDIFGAENPSKVAELRAAYQKYSTSLTEEPNVSWRDTGEPTDAEIKEAQRQKDEVKAKWTNPDGTMKKGYHLAPNGKESKLTEEQWLLVRTPNFKKWFGDWEKQAYANAAMDFLKNTAPVKKLSGGEFQKDGVKLTEKVPAFFKSINNVAHNEELGDVVLDLKGVEDSVAHGVGRLKSAAFMAVPEVIEKGFIFNRERNWKERGWDTAVIVAPVKIGEEDYVCEVVVKKVRGQQRFYLHEVEIKKTLDGVFKSVANNGNASQVSKLIIGKHLAEVKGNVSQVVDENGEPLVVYHGTAWEPFAEKAGDAVFKDESYFTANKNYANRYKKGGEVYGFFLNIRKPFDTRNSKEREIFEKEFYRKWGNGAPLSERGLPDWTDGSDLFEFLQEKGYDYDSLFLDEGGDGGYGDAVSYRGESYVPINANQIKSATDNVETYSENPDIRWSIREDSEAEQINRQFRELYDRYKGGDKAAYEEAAKMVADYAESKGYDVKVYHGTGADGFNIAKADASEAKNGEGAQAHGMGLYLATEKRTAEGYRDRAPMQERYTIGGKTFEELGITREKLNHPVIGLVQLLHSRGVEDIKKRINARIEIQTKRLESSEKYLQHQDVDGGFAKELALQTVADAKKELADERKTLSTIDRILSILEENGLSISDYEYTFNKGKVFDWRTNLKPENVLDEDKTLNEQNAEVQKKFKKAFDEDILPLLKESYGFDEDELASAKWAFDFSRGVRRIVSSAKRDIGAHKFNEIMLKHGIKGITYDGRQDGRCYVSFEGGSAVKLQDPFTFDDNGQLIPLSERFDETNPDMRWRDDTVLMPIDINVLVARNIDALMNAIRKSHKSVLTKKAELDKKYPDDDKDRKSKIQNDLRLYILENFSSELVPIAKLSDEDFKFYRKQFGIRDRFVYTSFGYAIEHYFNRHPDTPIENYLLLPDTIINPDKKKEVGKWIKDELGEWIYDASQAFVKEYDKWHVSTIKVDTQLTQSGKKLIAFKNFYGAKKEPYGNKKTIEDYWKNATSSSDSSRRQAKISTLNNFNRQRESSTDGIENQENNSRLRYLLRQERTENPVIWASIVLAKEILNGRGITRAKVEKVLPTAQFDGSKQNYAVERAQRIAEKTKATQKQFAKDLDIAIRKAESDLYWQDEFVENAYRSFSKGGEEYGFAKQKLMQYLKDLKNRELNKVKGYETNDFDVDLVDAILKAQEAEPERAAGGESKAAGEEVEEELEEADGAFEGDDEFSGKKTPLAPSKIRDVIGAIRREVVKRVRDSDGDQKTLDEKYRKTLVNVLTDAMKELVYGKEREDIGRKIEELKNVKHAVITVKDGERVGQKIDNFTLRAENIALRIFKRGVRDDKKAMTDKLDAILARRGKKPSRMQREDKRSMAGLVQQRIYNISKYVEMDAEELENARREAVAKLENVDENFVQDAENGKIREDVEDVRAEVVNALHDIEMFGGWADKSRAEMAEALEFLEKTIDTETAAQKVRVQERKERNAAVRKIISDALKMSEHNAAFDGGLRVAIRKVLNGSLPFDSFLGLLGECATGEKRRLFEQWRRDFVARVDRAANAKANEVFQIQQKFIKLVEDSYKMNFHDALKRLLEKKGEYEKFSKPIEGKVQPMSLANVIQLYVSAAQKNYERNFYEHRAVRSPEYKKLQDEIDEIRSKFPERSDKTGDEWESAKARVEELEKRQEQMRESALEDYMGSIEKLLSDGDRRFIEGLRQLYKDGLPSISAVAKRVIGLPIEQADALYMPVKVKRSGNLGEGVPQVPVVPKSLSPRVPHLRDLDETADPISLFTDRISENAQFKHFSELYLEIFLRLRRWCSPLRL